MWVTCVLYWFTCDSFVKVCELLYVADLHCESLWFVVCCWPTLLQLCEILWVVVCCWLTLWNSVTDLQCDSFVKVWELLYVADLHCIILLLTYNVRTLWKFVICFMLLTYLVTALWKSVSCLCVAVTAPPLLDVGSAFNVLSNQRQNVCKL